MNATVMPPGWGPVSRGELEERLSRLPNHGGYSSGGYPNTEYRPNPTWSTVQIPNNDIERVRESVFKLTSEVESLKSSTSNQIEDLKRQINELKNVVQNIKQSNSAVLNIKY
jgi:hypothetical protein